MTREASNIALPREELRVGCRPQLRYYSKQYLTKRLLDMSCGLERRTANSSAISLNLMYRDMGILLEFISIQWRSSLLDQMFAWIWNLVCLDSVVFWKGHLEHWVHMIAIAVVPFVQRCPYRIPCAFGIPVAWVHSALVNSLTSVRHHVHSFRRIVSDSEWPKVNLCNALLAPLSSQRQARTTKMPWLYGSFNAWCYDMTRSTLTASASSTIRKESSPKLTEAIYHLPSRRITRDKLGASLKSWYVLVSILRQLLDARFRGFSNNIIYIIITAILSSE